MVQIKVQLFEIITSSENVRKSFFNGTMGVVIIFDLTNPATLSQLDKWFELLESSADLSNIHQIYLVGTKIDEETKINEEEIRAVSLKWSLKLGLEIPIFRVSSKIPESGIMTPSDLFKQLSIDIIKKITSSQALTNEDKFLIKIVMLGDSGVGKTSLKHRAMPKTFSVGYTPTLGSDFDVIDFNVPIYEILVKERNVPDDLEDLVKEKFEEVKVESQLEREEESVSKSIKKKKQEISQSGAVSSRVLGGKSVVKRARMKSRLKDSRTNIQSSSVPPPPSQPVQAQPQPLSSPEIDLIGDLAKEELNDEKTEVEDLITRQRIYAGISYYDRMIPRRNFDLVVNLSHFPIQEEKDKTEYLTGARKTQKRKELEFGVDIIEVVPLCPGCLVTPSSRIARLDKPNLELSFVITPLIQGDIDSRIEFRTLSHEYLAQIDIKSKSKSSRTARLIAISGFAIGVTPSALDLFVGENINSIVEERLDSQVPALANTFQGLNFLLIFEILFLIFAMILAFLLWRKTIPRDAKNYGEFSDDKLDKIAKPTST